MINGCFKLAFRSFITKCLIKNYDLIPLKFHRNQSAVLEPFKFNEIELDRKREKVIYLNIYILPSASTCMELN
jgi:hypothetical protein